MLHSALSLPCRLAQSKTEEKCNDIPRLEFVGGLFVQSTLTKMPSPEIYLPFPSNLRG